MQSKKRTTKKKSPPTPTVVEPAPIEWAFTTREGGMFHQLPLPVDKEFVKAMKEYVMQRRNQKRYLQHPEGSYNRNYTVIPIPKGNKTITIHIFALRFPDGKVWDSGLRTFR